MTVTAENITEEQIRNLREEQKAEWRKWAAVDRWDPVPEPFPPSDLDHSFAAICGRESIVGMFSGERITREEGIARCVEILNARAAKESK